MKQEEELTPEELRKKAHLMGFRLKNSGLDAETIYARLEKQGIPEDLAREVAKNMIVERKKEVIKETEPFYNIALIRIGIGVVAALAVYLLTDSVVIPTGILAGGIISALLAKQKME